MVPPRPKHLLLAQTLTFPTSHSHNPFAHHQQQFSSVTTTSTTSTTTKTMTNASSPSSSSISSFDNSRLTLPDQSYDPFAPSKKVLQSSTAVQTPSTTVSPPLPPTLPPRRSQVLQQAARQDFFNSSYEQWQIKTKINEVKNGDGSDGKVCFYYYFFIVLLFIFMFVNYYHFFCFKN